MTDRHTEYPLVAVIGRPNVGKSSLFNRITGRRLAVVHQESGTTRDSVEFVLEMEGKRFRLADTGGLERPAENRTASHIEAGSRRQIERALADAAAVIMVIDIQAGILPLDQETALLLRRMGKNVFVAANKADTAAKEDLTSEIERLGFPVYPVSALHGRGVDDLVQAVAAVVPAVDAIEGPDRLKVAVVGRPNVGKSSFINRMLNEERVIVSPVPGTTRDSIEIPFSLGGGPGARHYLLIDTPGIRALARQDEGPEKFSIMRTEQTIERTDVAIVIVESLGSPTQQDKRILDTVLHARKGCVLVVNKWDLAEVTQRKYGEELGYVLGQMSHVPVMHVSALTGFNMRRAIERIDEVAANISKDLPTPMLNRTLISACERSAPPMINGRRLKIYYATQIGKRPIRIALFVNNPRLLRPTFETYLAGCLRTKFALEGAPIVFELKGRKKD